MQQLKTITVPDICPKLLKKQRKDLNLIIDYFQQNTCKNQLFYTWVDSLSGIQNLLDYVSDEIDELNKID